MKKIVYLVVKPDGSVRCAQRPRMYADEVAIKVTLNFPEGWGRVIHEMDITMPDVSAVTDEEVIVGAR